MSHAAGATAARVMFAAGQASRGLGIAHGGYVFLLADSAFACACDSHGPVTVGEVRSRSRSIRSTRSEESG
ncbi:hypothetical protein DF19_28875 [Streptomyces olindensis]|nr:hypothetical protein DF19_28875 [Streptomyces olindensis]